MGKLAEEFCREKVMCKVVSRVAIPDLHNLIEFLATCGVVSAFAGYQHLCAYVLKGAATLCIYECSGERVLLLVKDQPFKQVRILFKKSSHLEDLLKCLKDEFNPVYVAYNLVDFESHLNTLSSSRREILLDITTIAGLFDKQVNYKFNKSVLTNRQLVFKELKPTDFSNITLFLDEWCSYANANYGYNTTAINDRNFLTMFMGAPNVLMHGVFDETKLVGISFVSTDFPANNTFVVSSVLKNLRGYKNLGVFIEVRRSQLLANMGFKKLLVGGGEVPSQFNFKKLFLANGSIQEYYSYELFKEANIKADENFLRGIWS